MICAELIWFFLLNLQMNQILINRSSDELFEFRMRDTQSAFIQNIKFVSSKSLSRAQNQDITLVYDGPRDPSLIQQLLPAKQVKQDLPTIINPSTKSTKSSPQHAELVDISTEKGNLTCHKFNDVLQIAVEVRNVFAMCPFGCSCMPEMMSKTLTNLNPMLLHR